MNSLKRYLKAKLLNGVLEKAAPLAGPDAAVAVYFKGRLAASAGSLPKTFDPDPSCKISRSLSLNSGEEGEVVLFVPDLDSVSRKRSESLNQLADFMAFSLQGFIEAEAARRAIASETLDKYRELSILHRAVFEMNNTLRLKDTVNALIKECQRETIPEGAGAVFLFDDDQQTITQEIGFGEGVSKLFAVSGSRLFREVVESGKGEIVNDLINDFRWMGEVSGINAMLIMPIQSPNKCVGALVVATHKSFYHASHLQHFLILSSVAGIAISNALNFESIHVLMEALLQALTEAIDSRDPYTAGHSKRVARLVVAFAKRLDQDRDGYADVCFTSDQISEIYYAGILHDIGKIGIKEDVLTKASRLPWKLVEVIGARMEMYGLLNDCSWQKDYERLKSINTSVSPSKNDLEFISELSHRVCKVKDRGVPLLTEREKESLLLRYGNLTQEERREIERHPAQSHRILQHIPFREGFRELRTIVRQHHERQDGSGYPDGLKGSEILFQSQLLAIADIYDAITQERHYKPAATPNEALKILKKEAEAGRLDRKLVGFFSEQIDVIEEEANFLVLTEHSAKDRQDGKGNGAGMH